MFLAYHVLFVFAIEKIYTTKTQNKAKEYVARGILQVTLLFFFFKKKVYFQCD